MMDRICVGVFEVVKKTEETHDNSRTNAGMSGFLKTGVLLYIFHC